MRLDDDGQVLVDDHQQTSVSGVYAVGDVVLGLNQISTGQGEGATAATAAHNRLRNEVQPHVAAVAGEKLKAPREK